LNPDGSRLGGDQLEYKVRMRKDATLIYEWSAADHPHLHRFYFDFHGHTLSDGKEMTVATYRKDTGTSQNGALTAPFDGVHGWYFQNQSLNNVVVHVRISGFYELVAPGETGNEAHIIANVPADRAIRRSDAGPVACKGDRCNVRTTCHRSRRHTSSLRQRHVSGGDPVARRQQQQWPDGACARGRLREYRQPLPAPSARLPELAYSWRKVIAALAAAGYHVIAPDQRGYGRTTGWMAR